MEFNPAEIAKLASDAEAARRYADLAGAFAMNLLAGVLILGVTFWLSGFFSRQIKRRFAQGRRRRRVDVTLANFLASMVRYLVVIVGLIAFLGQVGVKTTSILAVLGAASLAVGLALQGTLSNVAAGMMLLILRPYRVSDFVEIGGRTGTVRSLDLFTTELMTPDGLKVIVPNGKVFGDMIVNFNALGQRRIDVAVGVDYEDDPDLAIKTLLEVAAADPRVLEDPKPWAGVTELGDSSVKLHLRAWVKAPDFVDAQAGLIKACKAAVEAAGLKIPYPHQVEMGRGEFLGEETAEPKPTADPSGKRAARR